MSSGETHNEDQNACQFIGSPKNGEEANGSAIFSNGRQDVAKDAVPNKREDIVPATAINLGAELSLDTTPSSVDTCHTISFITDIIWRDKEQISTRISQVK